MMADIFGEGVTYTAEPASDDDEDIEAIDTQDVEDGYDAEGDFVDEPVDDADYEEDE